MPKMKLIYEMTAGNLVIPHTEPGNMNKRLLSTNGPTAIKLGIEKATVDLTEEERQERVLSTINPIRLEDRDYGKTNAVAFNKIYPKGDNTANAMLKGVVKLFGTDSTFILKHPQMVVEEFGKYLQFCADEKISITKGGFTAWLGCSRDSFNRYMNQETVISAILQKCCDYIGQMRTLHADEGKIPQIQHIFEMANSHGYSRSDPKNNINIQVNTGSYTPEEQLKIIDDVVDF